MKADDAAYLVMLTHELMRWRPNQAEFMAVVLVVGEFAVEVTRDVAKAEILQEYGIQVVKRELGTPKMIRVLAQTEDGQRWELTYKLVEIDEARESWRPVFEQKKEPEAVQTTLLGAKGDEH